MKTKGIIYEELFTNFKKGLRNGNWRKLRFMDNALSKNTARYQSNRSAESELNWR